MNKYIQMYVKIHKSTNSSSELSSDSVSVKSPVNGPDVSTASLGDETDSLLVVKTEAFDVCSVTSRCFLSSMIPVCART